VLINNIRVIFGRKSQIQNPKFKIKPKKENPKPVPTYEGKKKS